MADQPAWATMENERLLLGSYQPLYEQTMARVAEENLNARLWGRDASVWTEQELAAKEIQQRLGWLNLPVDMRLEVGRLKALKLELDALGISDVVLLGMGGSSLAPEVLAEIIGPSADGFRLHVLDSTVPAQLFELVAQLPEVTLRHTVYIIASKSGTTAEPLALYAALRKRLQEAVGPEAWANHLIAVTDPGTPLEATATQQGFRSLYLNPSDIGGRFSALSLYGLVPGALLGIDLDELLRRGHQMSARCRATALPQAHPGLQLGAALGALATAADLPARDKLTLITSPRLASFGAWAEQLIAESTGKQGMGILPIEGEPLDLLEAHGRSDRLYVYLRLDDDQNADVDALADALVAQGHPVIGLRLRDVYDLGAEFFRWEFATAVAGAILGINPFDQPNVESAKAQARASLQAYQEKGALPEPEVTANEPPLSAYGLPGAPDSIAASVGQLLAGRTERSYLAIMAYVERNQQTHAALQRLRRLVTEATNLPVTIGFGPRFLHSTGQLHKGGPDTGLFMQITADDARDLAIPGKSYTLGLLKRAQSLGDLRALQEAQRPVLGIHLGADVLAGLAALEAAIRKALP